MRDLSEVIKAVEIGEHFHFDATPLPSSIPEGLFVAAFNGSTDAAIELCEALLPAAKQCHVDWGPSGCGAEVYYWPKGLSGGVEVVGEGYDSSPSRALLAAVLKAYEKVSTDA